MQSRIRFYHVDLDDRAYFISTKRGKVYTCPEGIEEIKGRSILTVTRWIRSKGGTITPVVNNSPKEQ